MPALFFIPFKATGIRQICNHFMSFNQHLPLTKMKSNSFDKYFQIASLPFSIIKTYLLQHGMLSSPTDPAFKSSSDNQSYPELCLQAALDVNKFSVFRRHYKYNQILEHVSKKQGEEYYKIIHEDHGLSADTVLELIEPLQILGRPRLLSIHGLPRPVSTTALRYLKVALDIRRLKGKNLGHVVEIGCGYGGQAIMLDKVASLKSYTFYDLWQVNLLIKRVIENSGFSCKYAICTLRDYSCPRTSWDLAISNYAFSELPISLQSQYIDLVLSGSSAGYMTMNSGDHGKFGDIENMSKQVLVHSLPNPVLLDEIPLSMPGNYIITW